MISKRYNEQMGNYIAKIAEKQNTAIGYVPPPKKTNADRIRAMTDEELAALFTQDVFDGEPCFYCPVNSEDCDLSTDCKKCFLDWLKQEVTVNDS